MNILDLIYNGHFQMASGSRWSSNPARSAWVFCVLPTVLYALAAFAVFSVIAKDFIAIFPFSELAIQLAIIILVVVGSDFRFDNHWFGAKPMELPESKKSRAESTALLFSLGGFVVFIVTNIVLFTQW